MSESDARMLLGAVNYDARVTWNENTYFDKKNNIANFLVNIVILCMILGGLSVVAGVAFGGVRVLGQAHICRARSFDRPEQMEFISLHLAETMAQGACSGQAGPPEPRTVLKSLRNLGLRPLGGFLSQVATPTGLVDHFCKLLKQKTFISEKLLDTPVF